MPDKPQGSALRKKPIGAPRKPASPSVVSCDDCRRIREANDRVKAVEKRLRESHRDLSGAREIENTLHRYRDLFDAAPDAYLITDMEGVIREANQAASLLLGTERQRLPGLPLVSLTDEGDRRRLRGWLSDVRRARLPLRWQMRMRPHARPPFWTEVAAILARDPAGGPSTLRWVLREVADPHQAPVVHAPLSSAPPTAGSRADDIEADFDQFASAVTHDLASPLMSVAGQVRLLARDGSIPGGSDAAATLQSVEQELRHIGLLLKGLGLFADVARRDLDVQTCDLSAVVDAILAELKDELDAGDVRVDCRNLPAVQADRALVTLMLQHLVQNAIRYRGAVRPQIWVSARRSADECVLTVRDNGVGIEPRHVGGLFLIFQRLQAAEAGIPGIGIGLALCRKIAERHGGRIWVESSLGEGSSFHVALPQPAASE